MDLLNRSLMSYRKWLTKFSFLCFCMLASTEGQVCIDSNLLLLLELLLCNSVDSWTIQSSPYSFRINFPRKIALLRNPNRISLLGNENKAAITE
jgi:hypothetical protein